MHLANNYTHKIFFCFSTVPLYNNWAGISKEDAYKYNVSVQNVTNTSRYENKLHLGKKSVVDVLPNLLVYFLSTYLKSILATKNVVMYLK